MQVLRHFTAFQEELALRLTKACQPVVTLCAPSSHLTLIMTLKTANPPNQPPSPRFAHCRDLMVQGQRSDLSSAPFEIFHSLWHHLEMFLKDLSANLGN